MSIATISVFRYKPLARFSAFANMGRVLLQPLQANGLTFSKLMGSGINFGLIPDFSTYVFFGVWNDNKTAGNLPKTDLYQHLSEGTEQRATLYLQLQRAHGLWDGQDPFSANTEQPGQSRRPSISAHDSLPTNTTNNPVAVLTRATIRTRALPDFWRYVPLARQRLTDQADNLLFGIGIGEVPIVQQCTVSVWRNPAAIERYAYRQSGHKEVIRLTRERNWYSEELFARFSVLRAEGDLFDPIRRLIS
ncbi:MAG: spheroidene monooxygenase [Spirosoma sp.]|nr:spheroidene monooxygenase [Spirosoma sp.]